MVLRLDAIGNVAHVRRVETPDLERISLSAREGTTSVLRRSASRRVQTRRGIWRLLSSGPNPSSAWICGVPDAVLAIAHSIAPQL